MAACGEPGEDAALYATVKAVGLELCPAWASVHPGGQGFIVNAHTWKDWRGQKSHLAGER
jgi:phosphoribosylformylglycinamidine synthase